MEANLPQYMLEVSLGLLAGVFLYTLLLRKLRYFQCNRAFLLLWPILCVLVPALEFEKTVWLELPERTEFVDRPELIMETTNMNTNSVPLTNTKPQLTSPQDVQDTSIEAPKKGALSLFHYYGLGCLIMLLVLLLRLFHLGYLIRMANRKIEGSYILLEHPKFSRVATLGRFIFKNTNEDLHPMVLEHEQVHIRQWHSLDVFLMEVYKIFLWFHPGIYFFQKELRELHEYIADRSVIQRFNSVDYARLLITQATRPQGSKLVFSIPFAQSTKKRLLLMKTHTQNPHTLFRYLLLLPLLMTMLVLFAFKKVERFKPSSLAKKAPISIKWLDKSCNCFPSTIKGEYNCDILNFSIIDLDKLSASPPLIAEQKEDDKTILKPKEYILAIQKAHEYKDPARPIHFSEDFFGPEEAFWKQLKAEDVLRFRAKLANDEVVVFKLGLRGWNHNKIIQSFFSLGEKVIPLDNITHFWKLSMSVDDFKKEILGEDMSLFVNGKKLRLEGNFIFDKAYKGPFVKYRHRDRKFVNRTKTTNLNQELIFSNIQAGERINVEYTHKDGKTFSFEILLEGEHPLSNKNIEINWGPYQLTDNTLKIDPKDLATLQKTSPQIIIDGKKLPIQKDYLIFKETNDAYVQNDLRQYPSYAFKSILNATLSDMAKAAADDSYGARYHDYNNYLGIPIDLNSYFYLGLFLKDQASWSDWQAKPFQLDWEMDFPVKGVTNPNIYSGFGRRIHPVTKEEVQHKGIDFSFPEGTPVYAVADGEVIEVKYDKEEYGKMILIQHEGERKTLYSKLQTYSVKIGDRVERGAPIGSLGKTGHAARPHLYFELWIDDEAVDPMPYFPVITKE